MTIGGMARWFREMLDDDEPIALPGCYDALSALLVEKAGFQSVFVSGYGVAASLLGNPDVGLTSLTETMSVARNIVSALSVPVVLDIDNGYGNEEGVIRTVREAEAAGVAAVQLEDQESPKRCGHTSSKRVCSLDAALRKLEAALEARRTPLCMIARTDAVCIDEAIARASAFSRAGADVTLVDGLRSAEDLGRVAAEVPGHKQVNLIIGGKTPLHSEPELAAMGFKIILYSTPALYVGVRAISSALAELRRTRDLRSIEDRSEQFDQFQRFMESIYYARLRRSDRPGVAPGHPSAAAAGPRS